MANRHRHRKGQYQRRTARWRMTGMSQAAVVGAVGASSLFTLVPPVAILQQNPLALFESTTQFGLSSPVASPVTSSPAAAFTSAASAVTTTTQPKNAPAAVQLAVRSATTPSGTSYPQQQQAQRAAAAQRAAEQRAAAETAAAQREVQQRMYASQNDMSRTIAGINHIADEIGMNPAYRMPQF